MTQDVLTAAELNSMMIAKSREVDSALEAFRVANEEWVQADRVARRAEAQAYLLSKGKTVPERRALVELECEDELFDEHRLDALRNAAREALRARLAQLSALQSLASAAREEMRLARTEVA